MFTGPDFNRPEGIIGSQYLDPLSRPSTHASPDSNCREEPGSLESRIPPRRVHVDSDIREFWPYPRRLPRSSRQLQDLPESAYSYKENQNPGSTAFPGFAVVKKRSSETDAQYARVSLSQWSGLGYRNRKSQAPYPHYRALV